MGPKSSVCHVLESIKTISVNQVCMESVTQTPDVPSGSAFQARVSICLLYQSKTSTRIVVSSQVEYLKSTWIKMAIDRAVPEGIKDYHTALAKELDSFIRSNPSLVDEVVKSPPIMHPAKDTSENAQSPSSQSLPEPIQNRIPTNPLLIAIAVLVCVNLVALYSIYSLNSKLNQVLQQLPVAPVARSEL
jgi:hypothetical protein